MKKIFALVMVVSILGAFMAGCSKPAEDTAATAGGTATTGGTAATAGGTAATGGATTGK